MSQVTEERSLKLVARSILNKEKAEKIAADYCTNGFNKRQALLNNGYSDSYASSGTRERVFKNKHVRQAIANIQAQTTAKTTYTMTEYIRELTEAQEHARKLGQPSAEISAIIAKGRTQGFDKDNDISLSNFAPKPLTKREIEVLRQQAEALDNIDNDTQDIVSDTEEQEDKRKTLKLA